MRIVITPAGSRGDFQPLLALAVGLRGAGHDVLLVCAPNFASEATAFGVPVRTVGIDVEAYLRDLGGEVAPLRGTYQLFKIKRQMTAALIDEGLTFCRGADVIIGGGTQSAAPTIAEALGVPYLYIAYTPQAIQTDEHPPFTIPFHGLAPSVNRWLWRASSSLSGASLGGPINRKRRQLGLAPVMDWYQHFFPTRRMLIAADPELAPMPQNVSLPFTALGSLHLPDERPLSPVVERFLSAGPAPVYIGFGSMRDPSPDATTALFMAAARAAHVRLVLSAGWARYGGANVGDARSLSDDVLVVGPSTHALLFPRVRAVVHHGGAGTTSAALRAGRPQVVVPHAFDQFQWARWVHSAGLGPEPIARKRLSVERLARALSEVSSEPRYAERAEALMRAARKHDPVAGVLRVLSQVVAAR